MDCTKFAITRKAIESFSNDNDSGNESVVVKCELALL